MNINAELKSRPVDSVRGAPMGRADWGLIEYRDRPMMMYVQRVRFVDGDSPSLPLFCAWAEEFDARVFVRAKDRTEAKHKAKEYFPNAKFFR